MDRVRVLLSTVPSSSSFLLPSLDVCAGQLSRPLSVAIGAMRGSCSGSSSITSEVGTDRCCHSLWRQEEIWTSSSSSAGGRRGWSIGGCNIGGNRGGNGGNDNVGSCGGITRRLGSADSFSWFCDDSRIGDRSREAGQCTGRSGEGISVSRSSSGGSSRRTCRSNGATGKHFSGLCALPVRRNGITRSSHIIYGLSTIVSPHKISAFSFLSLPSSSLSFRSPIFLRAFHSQLPTAGFMKRGKGRMTEGDSSAGSRRVVWYLCAAFTTVLGLTFAFVPLYEVFCQQTGYGGITQVHKEFAPPPDESSRMAKRLIRIDFCGTVTYLPWEFKPSQKKLVVAPGETALAFYTAKNLSDKPIIGMSVYHVTPPEAGIYFNKIQCFCFEEQMLNPGEEVDMPVFFFIDPDIVDDPRLDEVEDITLSYYFFEATSEIPEEYRHLKIGLPTSKAPPAVAV